MSAPTPKPNLLFIITDQQRNFRHWDAQVNPATFLPSMGLLQKIGAVTFQNAMIAASMCSPSRATFMTSAYACQSGVAQVSESAADQPLQPNLPNLCKLLAQASAGYEVVWKGKWHLGYKPDPTSKTSWLDGYVSEVTTSSLQWNPGDAGTTLSDDDTLGGGTPNNDQRYLLDDGTNQGHWANREPGTSGMKTYLAKYYEQLNQNSQIGAPTPPFCMFASFVNPHDCHLFNLTPSRAGYDPRFDPVDSTQQPSNPLPNDLLNAAPTGGDPNSLNPPFSNYVTLSIPPNNQPPTSGLSNPTAASRPQVQVDSSESTNDVLNNLDPYNTQLFINFYAYLQQQVDAEIYDLLTYLQSIDNGELLNNTLIIRFSDHGEQALSHGFREKGFNCYEETINVPLIIAHSSFASLPAAVANPTALVSLLDLVPTIADLVGADTIALWNESYPSRGRSFRSLIPYPKPQQPTTPHPNGVVFTYDDVFGDTRIRCIRTDSWKYAIYYPDAATQSPPSNGSLINSNQVQFELYNLCDAPFGANAGVTDPGDLALLAASTLELNNLAMASFNSPAATAAVQKQWRHLHLMLLSLLPDPTWYNNGQSGPLPPGLGAGDTFPMFGLNSGGPVTYPDMVCALPLSVVDSTGSSKGVDAVGFQNWMNNVTPTWKAEQA